MDWITRLTRAMSYIESHLADTVDWEQGGRKALCSGHQFARTFALMTGIPLSEYIRLRRLTLAAQDLQQRGDKVLDVALRYGYASPTAFQRAFAQFHGVTPSQAKKPGVRLKAYPPIAFHMTIQGGFALQYRLEEKPGIRVVGYEEQVSMVGGENFVRIPQMWSEMPRERYALLEQYADGRHPGMFGVIDMCDKPDVLLYGIAVSSNREDLQDWMVARTFAPATYAVFDTSLQAVQETTRRIFAEWLPHSGYEHAEAAELEYYPKGDMEDPAAYMCEIWIPVIRK